MQNATIHTDKAVLISEKDLEKLTIERNELKRQFDELTIERNELTIERNELKRQFEELKRMIFGSKSERYIPLDDTQLRLFEDMLTKKEEELEKHTIVYQREKSKKKKEQPVRSAIPAHFPRVEEIIEPDNLDPNAVKIGEEITELLEIKPLTIFVRRIVRPKYALPKEQGVVIADLPSLPIPKGNASYSLLAFILISKFIDHLPLYRLLQIFKRQELIISKSTIGGWVSKTSELLRPLYDTFKDKFLENVDYVQADESPIKVQDKIKRKTTHRGFMWVYRNPDENLILFDYNKGRGKNVPEEFFYNFTGTLQSDGYKVYKNLVTKGNIRLLGCMAHARRYFEKALTNDPKRADHILLIIQQLYKIERKLKEREASIEVIKRYRMLYALPILNELEIYLKSEKNKVLPKSSIGIAINYTLNIFDDLKGYINDGRFEIDNNNIENAIRPLAIGRKNYLFAGSHESAQNIAMFYSFFATCKNNNINPYTWLCDIIKRMPEHKANKLSELLPQNWKPLELDT
jgi:transposase